MPPVSAASQPRIAEQGLRFGPHRDLGSFSRSGPDSQQRAPLSVLRSLRIEPDAIRAPEVAERPGRLIEGSDQECE
jgi:hypothetical protein